MDIREMIVTLMDMKSDISIQELKPGQKQKDFDDKMEALDQAIILFEKVTPKAPRGISITHEGRVGNCAGYNKLLFEWKEAEICRCGQKITWNAKKVEVQRCL